MKKNLGSILLSSLLTLTIASCGDNPSEQVPSDTASTKPSETVSADNPSVDPSSNYKPIATDTNSEIWIMTWSGDGQDHLDIGHNPLPTSQINALNVGILQGVAKEFNKIYPNIKVNIHTEASDPNSGGTSWAEKINNFKETHGVFPDIWASLNIIDDMNKGLVADLSVFEEDPDYAKFNPNLMKLTNYYGFQAGLPQYAIPWGVYVNRQLARDNNITIRFGTDWTWDDYTNFIKQGNPIANDFKFAGCYDASMMIPRGAFIERQLQTTEKGNEYNVNFATPEFLSAIEQLPAQSASSILGGISGLVEDESNENHDKAAAFIAKGNSYSYNYFKDNMLLTFDGEPWMLFESAAEGSTNYINSTDWDIYPRPAFLDEKGDAIVDNHVGVCLDPCGLYNYALEDGNPELSDAEYAKLNVAWTFSKFWLTDTRAWNGKANEKYTAINSKGDSYEVPCVNDTFPVVVEGADFDQQMEIWYSSTNHSAYKNATQFKGFAKVVDLWRKGNIYGISDKAFPRYYHLDGDATDYSILEKIDGFGSESLVGVAINDEAWASTYGRLLKSIQKEVNGHYNQAFEEIKQTLRTYYGWNI